MAPVCLLIAMRGNVDPPEKAGVTCEGLWRLMFSTFVTATAAPHVAPASVERTKYTVPLPVVVGRLEERNAVLTEWSAPMIGCAAVSCPPAAGTPAGLACTGAANVAPPSLETAMWIDGHDATGQGGLVLLPKPVVSRAER